MLCDIPVVLVTIVDEKNRGFSLGASEYLVKPVDRDKLVSVLQRLSTPPGDQILVVDDEESSRSSLRMALEQAGWRVEEANNGQVALARLNEMRRPSAILLDLMMPEMDGFEFLDGIRHHDKWRNIPVVVITARDITAEDRARLNGRVESIVQKAGQGDMLRQVRSELEKCMGREARDRTAPA
jgi:CheY-like chemotaxis protein